MVSRRTMLTTGVGIAAGLTTGGCAADANANAKWAEAGSGDDGKPKPSPTFAAKVTVTPAAETKDVSPAEAVVISVEGGIIQTVTLTGGAKTVEGTVDTEQRTWRSSGPLEYGKTYTVKVLAVDTAGLSAEQQSTFTTVKPSATATVTFQANALVAMKNGGTYGVGQPVCVHFSKAIKDRTTAEQAMTVTAEPSVEGRWRWINSQTAHWRPARYWTAGTKITVKIDILGVNLGNKVYGAANASIRFSIGQSRIAIADCNTHRMKCYVNGKMVRDIPVSLGKGGTTKTSDGRTVHFWTNNGPHVVLKKDASVRMTSSSYGVEDPSNPNYYDELVKLCCRISYSGEFVHLADWNTSAHGRTNTSHGCINVGPANAQWFYDTFQIGDVVEVKNSPKALAIDNGLGDWMVSWEKW